MARNDYPCQRSIKGMKKGAAKKLDLRDCCGALHLDSENTSDLKLLTAMPDEVAGRAASQEGTE